MPKKRTIRGSGITKRQIDTLVNPTDDEITEWVVRHNARFLTFDELIDRIEKRCREILTEHLKLHPLPPRRVEIIQAVGGDPNDPIHVPIPEGKEYDSEVGYARRLFASIRGLRTMRERGELDPFALELACQIGALEMEAAMKFRWEPEVLKWRGGSNVRRDCLGKLILKALKGERSRLGREPTYGQMLDSLDPEKDLLKRYDEQSILQELEWDKKRIAWRSLSGKEKKTSFKAFQNRLSLERSRTP